MGNKQQIKQTRKLEEALRLKRDIQLKLSQQSRAPACHWQKWRDDGGGGEVQRLRRGGWLVSSGQEQVALIGGHVSDRTYDRLDSRKDTYSDQVAGFGIFQVKEEKNTQVPA